MAERLTCLTVHLPCGSLELRHVAGQRAKVIAAGQQGPAGRLTPEAMAQVEQAITAAETATAQAQTAVASVNALVDDLTSSFTFYGGAIAAQEPMS
ncbi:hypothetical protein [Halomonas organivorans]|uniref:Uncharacterized protein n=1 Tax=Halomonas organivorans TaxID=257772 RepID=A0A7W5G688_9GAMM|nr:hypothetical protein [Halomonas organivorans]MBB3141216.1 hypothetical protein [Halomonas organivorans]